ncbi:MAG: hypothetical protein Kow0069_28640 [Promethearchaeota archaeon]
MSEDSNAPEFWFQTGRKFAAQKDLPRAEKAFRKAIELDRTHVDSWVGLGVVLEAMGRLDEATKAYGDCRDYQPGNPEPLYFLGRILVKLGRLDEAEDAFRKALEVAPLEWPRRQNVRKLLTQVVKAKLKGIREEFAAADGAGLARPRVPAAVPGTAGAPAVPEVQGPGKGAGGPGGSGEDLRRQLPWWSPGYAAEVNDGDHPVVSGVKEGLNALLGAYDQVLKLEHPATRPPTSEALWVERHKFAIDVEGAFRRVVELAPNQWYLCSTAGNYLSRLGEVRQLLRRSLGSDEEACQRHFSEALKLFLVVTNTAKQLLDWCKGRDLEQLAAAESEAEGGEAAEAGPEAEAGAEVAAEALEGQSAPSPPAGGAAGASGGALAGENEYYVEATRLLAAGEYDDAEELLREAVKQEPSHAGAWHQLANLLAARDQAAEAEAAYRAALLYDPGLADAWYNFGLLLVSQKRLQEALEAFKAAVRSDPSHADAWTNLGGIFKATGDLRNAEEAFRKALEVAPDGWQFLDMVAQWAEGLIAQNQSEPLGSRPADVAGIVPELASTAGALEVPAAEGAVAEEARGEKAEEARGEAVQECGAPQAEPASTPATAKASASPAQALLDQGRRVAKTNPKLAEASFRDAIDLDPGNPDAHAGLGIVLKAQGRLDEAKAAYEAALEVAPPGWKWRDNVEKWAAELDAVLSQAGEAAGAGTPGGEIELGVVPQARDLPQTEVDLEAVDEAEPAGAAPVPVPVPIEDAPPDPEEVKRLYSEGRRLASAGDLSGSEEKFRAALRLAPDDPASWTGLGVVLRAQGRVDEAETAYRTAIMHDDSHADAWYYLGILLHAGGRVKEAKVAYEKALNVAPLGWQWEANARQYLAQLG